ncbi:MAG: hypothetical protein SWN98_07740 [Pseudomonadota bacterium]|jgi:ABC-type transporter Mla subunit MlaD|uniref:ABC-type transporter Mla subunit MlaD n=1 Tax=Actibacterium naphthalenivorans TaxID=1614693 RepID=A0A840CGE8_9RHOB|nr:MULTISPECIES: hypothetical protein [Actibacterium]MBB4021886.1 ABC-type transporter Mla subunit MlaD [Actibacterium naphthalenivorans]MDY6859217.1 hypothetical protein [Pseudomonadota bacterium]
MAENTNSTPALAFILGAVVVLLGGVVWYVYSGGEIPGENEPEIQIDLPDGG